MIRVKIFVVRTASDADYLIEQFNRSGIKAVALDDALLHDDHGRPLFENRTAGVMCPVANDADAQQIDDVFRTLGIDAIALERTFRGKLDRPGERLAVAFQTLDPVQASLMRNLLEEQGVSAVVSGAWLMGGHGESLMSVLVAQDDLDTAEQIVDSVAHLTVQNDSLEEEEELRSENASDGQTITTWPVCPGCQRRRTTICPYCDTAGNEFPLADDNFAAGMELPQPTLAVICTTCDEPWAPQFFRRCEWCGHDFGQGLNVDYEPQPTTVETLELEPTNGRVLTVLFGLIAFFALVCAYFAVVIRS